MCSGYIAGVFCAVVSHPADTLVSKLNQTPEAGIGGIVRKLGWAGMWKGLTTRIIMVGTLTGLQWWIYDTFKTAVGLQVRGVLVLTGCNSSSLYVISLQTTGGAAKK